MKRTVLWGSLATVAFGGLLALPLAFASSERPSRRADCPGTVICPLTGEEVCKDRCAVGGAGATTAADEDAGELPSCCRKAK